MSFKKNSYSLSSTIPDRVYTMSHSLSSALLRCDTGGQWTISSADEGTVPRGLVKYLKIVIETSDIAQNKRVKAIPIMDALGGALSKTDRSAVFVKSKTACFATTSEILFNHFEHKSGRTAMIGDQEFLLNDAEITLVSAVLFEADFDDGLTDIGSSFTRSSTISSSHSKGSGRNHRHRKPKHSKRWMNIMNWVAHT